MKAFLCVALCCIFISSIRADGPKTINVGVVEGEPIMDSSSKSKLQANADQYIDLLYKKVPAKGFNIIVFPEYGLTGRNFDDDSTVTINDTDVKNNKNLEYLDNIAKKKNVYLVANVLEKDDDDLYSTTVVLNGTNVIVAKYRKTNLNDTEDKLKSDNQISTFNTDAFGTIGLISGDDILYENPVKKLLENNVTTIIYTSSLRSIAPFKTAISLHAGFAKAHNVNLLVASLNAPYNGTSGSGIYKPCEIVDYFITAGNESKALTGTIEVNPGECTNSVSKERRLFGTSLGTDPSPSTLLQYNYDELTTEIINENSENRELCDGSFCCKFNISSSTWNKTENYRLAVSGGNQKVCALISCSGDKVDTCGIVDNKIDTTFEKIDISTSEGDAAFLPYILHKDLTPGSDIKGVTFTENSDDGTTFSAKSTKETVAIGIVSAKSGANSLHIVMTNLILSSLLLKYLL